MAEFHSSSLHAPRYTRWDELHLTVGGMDRLHRASCDKYKMPLAFWTLLRAQDSFACGGMQAPFGLIAPHENSSCTPWQCPKSRQLGSVTLNAQWTTGLNSALLYHMPRETATFNHVSRHFLAHLVVSHSLCAGLLFWVCAVDCRSCDHSHSESDARLVHKITWYPLFAIRIFGGWFSSITATLPSCDLLPYPSDWFHPMKCMQIQHINNASWWEFWINLWQYLFCSGFNIQETPTRNMHVMIKDDSAGFWRDMWVRTRDIADLVPMYGGP